MESRGFFAKLLSNQSVWWNVIVRICLSNSEKENVIDKITKLLGLNKGLLSEAKRSKAKTFYNAPLKAQPSSKLHIKRCGSLFTTLCPCQLNATLRNFPCNINIWLGSFFYLATIITKPLERSFIYQRRRRVIIDWVNSLAKNRFCLLKGIVISGVIM